MVVTGSANIKRAKEEWYRKKAERDRKKSSSSNSSTKSSSLKTEKKLYTPVSNTPSFTELAKKVTSDLKNAGISGGIPSNYEKLDRFFGGYLPAGYTPLQDEYLDTRDKSRTLKVLNPANETTNNLLLDRERQNNVFNQQMDLIRKSWYEQLGLFQDAEEKRIQNLQRIQAYNQEGLIQLPNTLKAVERFETYISETPNAQTVLDSANPSWLSNLTKPLLIGGVIILGIILFKRK